MITNTDLYDLQLLFEVFDLLVERGTRETIAELLHVFLHRFLKVFCSIYQTTGYKN